MEIAELNLYISGNKRYAGYAKACKLYEALRKPAEGEYDFEAINERRPAESAKVQEYRAKIWVELSKEVISQITTNLSKIRRSSDWSVTFDKKAVPASIPENETLQAYTEKYFPFYTTYESYVFSVLLKNYLIDPNAVILIAPLNIEVQPNEYLKPYPVIFNTHQVLDFVENQYAVIEIKKKRPNGGVEDKEYLVIDTEFITRYKPNGNGYAESERYEHNLGVMPAFRMRGRFYKDYDNIDRPGRHTVNESPIQTVAPRLKEFDREYSDLQAEVVQHIHSESWQWATQLCKVCENNGVSTGKIVDKKTKKQTICPQCHGSGQVAASPYSQMVVRPSKSNMGEQPAPIPPKGYITKPVDIVKIQDERCEKHAYKALCSINMQFLMQVPQNQSGYAKDVDREELNNFAYGIAEDIVWMMDRSYWLFAKYRYRVKSDGSSLSDEEIAKLVPKIAVPEKFDLISSNYLLVEMKSAQEAKVHPLIFAQLNYEYASKAFYNEPEISAMLKLSMRLDPLPGLSDDEKMTRLSNYGITELDYIISCNIWQFTQRAIEENKDFYGMPMKEQKAIMRTYATEIQSQQEALKESEQKENTLPEVSANGVNGG